MDIWSRKFLYSTFSDTHELQTKHTKSLLSWFRNVYTTTD